MTVSPTKITGKRAAGRLNVSKKLGGSIVGTSVTSQSMRKTVTAVVDQGSAAAIMAG